MDNTDTVLGGLASGDKGSTPDPQMSAPPPPLLSGMKREHDSTDDFEHLDRDRQEAGESPLHAPRVASQSFLDMERDPAGRLADQFADKFTDSESDADTAGESPLHRPAPAVPVAPAAVEPAPLLDLDPTPVLHPAPAPPREELASFLAPEKVPESHVDPPAHPHVDPPAQPHVDPPAELRKDLPAQPRLEPTAQTRVDPPAQPRAELPPPQPKEPPAEPKAESGRAPVAHVIEAEVIFCQMGLDAWFDPQRLHPEVESLIYWRNPARSGGALGAGLALLVALACCSVVSVLAYSSLLALSAAVAFRVYKNVLQAVQKTSEGHPFKWLLEQEITVPAERAQSLAAAATAHLNAGLSELRRLFLVEDLVDSLKFGVLLWCLTYVGACFNGITLIILGWIALFTLPKAYEMNKSQVDANLELARAKINEISAKVRAAVPLGRKSESEKDK